MHGNYEMFDERKETNFLDENKMVNKLMLIIVPVKSFVEQLLECVRCMCACDFWRERNSKWAAYLTLRYNNKIVSGLDRVSSLLNRVF